MDTDFSSDLSLINSFNKQVIVQALQHERPVPTLISGARQIVWLIDEIACLGENREELRKFSMDRTLMLLPGIEMSSRRN